MNILKVLSVEEPFATLIVQGYKKFEFRTWQTKYRGYIYIHAGLSEDKKEMELVKDYNLFYKKGYIIGKARLIDCILVDDEMNKKLKTINPLVYANNYVGCYAWVLEDVEVLDDPIPVKGHLGIWNYYSIKEIDKIMSTVNYGWLDKNKKVYTDGSDTNFSNTYSLAISEDVLKYRIGTCFDQVELERKLFQNTFLIHTYFITTSNPKKDPTHTFLVYKKNNRYVWYEHAWSSYRGHHSYESLEALLKDVRDKFNKEFNLKDLKIYEYFNLPKNISETEFYEYCTRGNLINL